MKSLKTLLSKECWIYIYSSYCGLCLIFRNKPLRMVTRLQKIPLMKEMKRQKATKFSQSIFSDKGNRHSLVVSCVYFNGREGGLFFTYSIGGVTSSPDHLGKNSCTFCTTRSLVWGEKKELLSSRHKVFRNSNLM